jgi:hypothetical protein
MRALGSCLREFLPGILMKLLTIEQQRQVLTDTAAGQLKRKAKGDGSLVGGVGVRCRDSGRNAALLTSPDGGSTRLFARNPTGRLMGNTQGSILD